MIWRAARVVMVCGVVATLAGPACGGSASNGDAPVAGGGSGGAGSSSRGGSSGKSSTGGAGGAVAAPVPCGTKMCDGIVLQQLQSFDIPGCCADAATSSCGLDSSVLAEFGQTFSVACQPLAQPGTVDNSCPASPSQAVTGTAFTINFPGCCRSTGVCGYQLDTIGGLIQLGLGCVDSTPFLDGGTPTECGESEGGEGGVAGAVAGPSEAGASGARAGASGS